MIPMTLDDIAVAIGAAGSAHCARVRVTGISIDSRTVKPGDLFVAIKGDRFDGHDFTEQAAANGAVACVCGWGGVGATDDGRGVVRLRVENTVEALGRLAAHYRCRVMPVSTQVVAVTGSNGKTTTKGMIDHVLGQTLKGRASPKSFNNAIGVPLTLLSVDADDHYVIAEIGTNAWGEVAALAALVSPDVAVITSIGEAHLEGLGDMSAVAAEKASLLDYVRPQGLAVVGADRPEIIPFLGAGRRARLVTFGFNRGVRLPVTGVRGDLGSTVFDLDYRYRVELNMPGAHHAGNAAAAFAVGRWFGLDPEEIIDRLRSFVTPEGRTEVFECGDVTVVDDSYNANPASVLAAVETLARVTSRRRVLVMGDMLELGRTGPAWHRRVVEAARAAGIEILVAVGPLAAEASRAPDRAPDHLRVITCRDAGAALDAVTSILAPGDVVWVKGSRAMHLDEVVRGLRCRYKRSAVTGGVTCPPEMVVESPYRESRTVA